jgi:hypothetical protein
VLARRLRGLPGLVIPVPHHVQHPQGRAWLERSTLVIGAVDGMRTRDYIERVCRAALVPYVDIGLTIKLGDDDETVEGIGGQVFVSLPGAPCMRCANIITDELLARDREEYVAGRPEQQVVSMNGILASEAVNAVLWMLTRYSAQFPPPLHLIYDGLEHRLYKNEYLPDECEHFPIAAAGWAVVLPPRRNAAS